MSFISETTVKRVRKPHRCDACPKPIEIGSPMVKWVGTTAGSFGACTYHTECRAAEIAYNRMAGSGYDDWVRLDDTDSEDWAWLLAEHPIVAARKGITAESIHQHGEERARLAAAWRSLSPKGTPHDQ